MTKLYLMAIKTRACLGFGLILGILLGVVSVPVQAAIYGFSEFDNGLYRGSHPDSKEDFELLKSVGIKTILSLQSGDSSILPEKEEATLNQMTYINIPVSYILPSKWKMLEILGHLQNDSLKPLYLHCRQGRDRTGLVVGMYRIHIQKEAAEVAFEEMIRFGFREKVQWVLRLFFKFYKMPGSLIPLGPADIEVPS
ncbi:MAG: tyrosine-protein phosphatase [Bdellovibrionia bacterium]